MRERVDNSRRRAPHAVPVPADMPMQESERAGMNFSELQEHVWRRLGPRKHIACRRQVDDLVRLCVETWEPDKLQHCRSEREQRVYGLAVSGNVKRLYHACSGYSDAEFGFLWAIVLSAVVNSIIWALIMWWFSESSHRVLMEGWKREFNR
jgi:hypothetical protein